MESNLLNRLDCANRMLFALWDAMERNAFSANTYADAVYGVYDYMSMLLEELRGSMEQPEHSESVK